jgi:hypothetical protein
VTGVQTCALPIYLVSTADVTDFLLRFDETAAPGRVWIATYSTVTGATGAFAPWDVASPPASGLAPYAVIVSTTGANIRILNAGTNVRGRFTIVCKSNEETGAGGDVFIHQDSLKYTGGVNQASASHALAVLAEGDIIFWANADQDVVGFYYSDLASLKKTGIGNVVVRGSVHGFLRENTSAATVLTVVPDPQLMRFPPPKLPEKPTLVTLRQR